MSEVAIVSDATFPRGHRTVEATDRNGRPMRLLLIPLDTLPTGAFRMLDAAPNAWLLVWTNPRRTGRAAAFVSDDEQHVSKLRAQLDVSLEDAEDVLAVLKLLNE